MDIKLLKYLLSHPLNRRQRARAVAHIAAWAAATRLLRGCEVIIPFANQTRLLVTPGRWGSEANALCGLHEFNDMGFLLHLLRSGDAFCDVGANIGAYTVLASGAAGAQSLAFEPVRTSYAELCRNIDINALAGLAQARHAAVGRAPGSLRISSQYDTMNHVLDGGEGGPSEEVPVETLDDALNGTTPCAIKIDVEGWENEVLAGAQNTLTKPGLQAIVIELNQSGARYGFSDAAIHEQLLGFGFSPWRYRPFERELVPLSQNNNGGNTIYVRNHAFVIDRLKSAPQFTVRDQRV